MRSVVNPKPGTRQEVPAAELPSPGRPWQLLVISARSPTALEAATDNLYKYLSDQPKAELADVAYTLQVGRRHFPYRRVALGASREDIAQVLNKKDPTRFFTRHQEPVRRPVFFLFPGQGSQYPHMGMDLYRTEPQFLQIVDQCAELLFPHLGLDVRQVLYPALSEAASAQEQLSQTWLAQPALFVIEYALARLWTAWGIEPQGMLGHSVGEYVAASLAGVFSLEDALALVAARGRLMQALPPGAMLAVMVPEEEARSLAGDHLDLAAVNGPSFCVLSGPIDAVEAVQQRLIQKEIRHRRLHVSHAFHSTMMEPILDEFAKCVQGIHRSPPRLPYISSLSGSWITTAQATDPRYWSQQLRETVRFGDGAAELLKIPDAVLLEVGPGQTMGMLIRQQDMGRHVVLPSIQGPLEAGPDTKILQATLGQLWLNGVDIHWPALFRHERRQCVELPTYPFERQRYWIGDLIGAPNNRISTGERGGAALDGAPAAPGHKRPELTVEYVAPRDQIEKAVADVWGDLLGFSDVGVYDDFLTLGGHSLLATQLASRLRHIFPVELSIEKIFQLSTVEQQAELIRELLVVKLEQMTENEALQLMDGMQTAGEA